MKEKIQGLCLLLTLLASTLVAQSWSGDQAVAIHVNDSKGRAVANARVVFTFQGLPGESGPDIVASDSKGRAVLAGLAPGPWQVEISHPEYLSFIAMVDVRRGKKPLVSASFLEAGGRSLSPVKVKFSKGDGQQASPVIEARKPPSEKPQQPAVQVAEAPVQVQAPAPPPDPEPAAAPVEEASLPETAMEAVPVEETPVPVPAPTPPPSVSDPEPKPREEIVTTAPPVVAAEPEIESEVTPAPQLADELPLEEPAAVVAPEPEIEIAEPKIETEVESVPPPAYEPPVEAPEKVATPEPEAEIVEPEVQAEIVATAEVAAATPSPSPSPAPMPEDAPVESQIVPADVVAPEIEAEIPRPQPQPTVEPPKPAEEQPAAPMDSPPQPALAAPAAAAAAVPSPPDPGAQIHSQRDGSCPDCDSAEWTLQVSVAVPAADPGSSGSCGRNVIDAARSAMQGVSTSIQLELDGFIGPVANGTSQEAIRRLEPDLAEAFSGEIKAFIGGQSPCQVVGLVLPKAVRFSRVRLAASDQENTGNCAPGQTCAIGDAAWLGSALMERGPSTTVVYGLFENRSASKGRRAILTAYYRPPNANWKPRLPAAD